MAGGLIGALRVTLGIDASQFENGVKGATRHAKKMQRDLESIGQGITKAGQVLSVGLTLPFVALMRSAIPAAKQARVAAGQVDAALKSMGDGAGRSSEQLKKAAKELMNISTFDDDDILQQGTANLLTFGNIAEEQFDRAQKAAVDMASRLNMQLQPAFLMIGKALNDPAKGLAALRRVGIQFNDQQIKQIKTMTKAKDIAGAQRIMLAELERQFGGSAEAMRAAQPDQAFTNSWNDFQETVGEIALQFLPKLTKVLHEVLTWFQQLSPEAQLFAVKAMAIGAALGPVLLVLGPIVGTLGKLIPLLAAMGPAGTAAGVGATAAGAGATAAGAGAAAATPALGAMTAMLGPLAIAAGLVWVGFEKWPEISGIVERVGKRLKETAAEAENLKTKVELNSSAWADFSSQEAFEDSFGQALENFLVDTGRQLQALDKDLQRAQDWVDSTDAAIAQFAKNGWESFERFHARAQAAFNRLINEVTSMITGRFAAGWASIKKMTQDAGDWFEQLYDRVVGHSYVPDMVDEIGQQIGRLEAEMVVPVERSTKGASKAMKQMADDAHSAAKRTFAAMKQMRDDLAALLGQLFPEAVALRQLHEDIALLDRARSKNMLTPAQYEEAMKRVRERDIEERLLPADLMSDWLKDEELPEIDTSKWTEQAKDDLDRFLNRDMEAMARALENRTLRIVQSFATMGQEVLASVDGIVQGFKSKDFVGVLQGVLDLVLKVVQGIQGAKANGGGILGFLTAFGQAAGTIAGRGEFGARGGGGSVIGMSTGGSMKVGGVGGVDSKLVRFRATPGELINVTRGDRANQQVAFAVYARKGEMFEVEVERVARPMADDAAVRGTVGGAAMAGRNEMRRQKGYLAS